MGGDALSNTEHRLAANRANALHSTGPVTARGRATASRNATRHGLLSGKLFLEDEDPIEFQAMFGDLWRSLNPVGTLEDSLVERVAVTLWRQRRLVHAETASLSLARQPRKIAKGTSSELGSSFGSEITHESLQAVDEEQVEWSGKIIAEIEGLEQIDLRSLEQIAPGVFGQLTSDAEEDKESTAMFVENHKGGLTGYIADLLLWCQEQQQEAATRPQILAIAEQVRAKRLVLPSDTLELLARYQTTLDNQLFKLLKALREAQEWRLETIEPVAQTACDDLEPIDHVA